MVGSQLRAMLARLPDARKIFRYFKDRYALMLLSDFVRDGRPTRDIKTSRFRGLLDKPPVRRVAARRGDGRLAACDLRADAPEWGHDFVITFAEWGCDDECRWPCCQMSRSGKNVVLQLNFPARHDADYQRLIKPATDHLFVVGGHPVRSDDLFTMAWARIDIDVESGEALIEEVQSDWIGLAGGFEQAAQEVKAGRLSAADFADQYSSDCGATLEDIVRYCRNVLRPYREIWEEATLAAAIWWLTEEIGIRRIFYHTYEGGLWMKSMPGTPPRSLYTALPRRFCFEKVSEWPAFLCTNVGPLFLRSDKWPPLRAEDEPDGDMLIRIPLEEPRELPEEPLLFHLLDLTCEV